MFWRLVILLFRVFVVVMPLHSCSYKDAWVEGLYHESKPSQAPRVNMSLFECIASCFTQNFDSCRSINFWINSTTCVFFSDTIADGKTPSGRSSDAIYIDMSKMPSEMPDVVGECNAMACDTQCTLDRTARASCAQPGF